MVQLLGMAHRDIPPWNQVTHNPGSTGCPMRFQFREIIRTLPILILGASYGSLLGTKLALAGHTVNLVCLPAEADLINREGAIVRLPVKGRDRLVEMQSKKLPGKLCAGGTPAFKPTAILRQLES